MSGNRKTSGPHDATVAAVGGAMGWSVVTRVLQMGLGLVGSIVVVRGLGPDRYGELAVLRTTLGFVSAICGLGLGQSILRYFPAARARGDRALALRLVRWLVVPQVLAWGMAVLVVWALGGWVARISYQIVAELFLLGTFLVVAELAFLAGTNLANAFYDTRALSAVTVGGALAYLSFVTLALARGYGVAGVLWASALGNVVMVAILAVRLAPRFRTLGVVPAAPSPPGQPPVSLGTVARYAMPFAAIAVMNLITWKQSESILLAHFRTMREAGYWDLAYRIPQMVLEFVPGAIWPLLMAGFSEIYTRDREKLNRAIVVYYKLLFLIAAPISMIGAAIGDRALVAFYGTQMNPAGPYCQAFFLIFSASFLSTPLSMAFYVLEKPGYSLVLYLLNSVAVVGLDFLLIPRWGLLGALIPMALVIGVSPWLNAALLRRCGVRQSIPWGFLSRIYLATLPCALLYPARLFVHGKVPVALAAMIAGLLYLAGLRYLRVLGEDEADLIRRSSLPFASRLIAFFRLEGTRR